MQQHTLKIVPSILFSFSGCSRQQTHSLGVGMILHHSQVHVHQNVLPTDCLLPCFRFRYLQDQEHVLAPNGKVEDQP